MPSPRPPVTQYKKIATNSAFQREEEERRHCAHVKQHHERRISQLIRSFSESLFREALNRKTGAEVIVSAWTAWGGLVDR